MRVWRFTDNWREGKLPSGGGPFDLFWVPLARGDKHFPKGVAGINRDPTSPDFLRPAKGSDAATKGLGTNDSAFPSYVGALPPAGEEAWDWQKTWEALTKGSVTKEQ